MNIKNTYIGKYIYYFTYPKSLHSTILKIKFVNKFCKIKKERKLLRKNVILKNGVFEAHYSVSTEVAIPTDLS